MMDFRCFRNRVTLTLLALISAALGLAQEETGVKGTPTGEQVKFFETEIRPP